MIISWTLHVGLHQSGRRAFGAFFSQPLWPLIYPQVPYSPQEIFALVHNIFAQSITNFPSTGPRPGAWVSEPTSPIHSLQPFLSAKGNAVVEPFSCRDKRLCKRHSLVLLANGGRGRNAGLPATTGGAQPAAPRTPLGILSSLQWLFPVEGGTEILSVPDASHGWGSAGGACAQHRDTYLRWNGPG